ncbi:MAG: hypothetical protein CMK92_00795 [Pseudomonas sp.]|nr:hypothetical protein [Pseudomonas sp.]
MRGHVVEYRHGEEHSVVRGDTQGFGRNVAVTDMFLFVASIAAVDVYTRQGYCDEKREWKHVTSFSPTNDAAFATTMVAVDKMLYIGSPRESLVYIYDMRHWTEPVLLEGRAGFGCGMREEQGTVMIASNKTTTWVRNGEIVEEREERHGSQRCV